MTRRLSLRLVKGRVRQRSWLSSTLNQFCAPWDPMFQHGIQNDQQLPHTSGQHHLCGVAQLGPATRILRRRSRVQHSLYGVNTRIFSDVAKEAARIAANQSAFERLYLLKAWEPELEAYEVFPVFATCK